MRFKFSSGDTESDVEQFFLRSLLIESNCLGIPEIAIRTKHTLRIVDLDKGTHKRRYQPDYVVYSDTFPALVAEAKSPSEDVAEGFREAQLYAHELNKAYPSGVNPTKFVLATNGIKILYGRWDTKSPDLLVLSDLEQQSIGLAQLRDQLSWESLQAHIADISRSQFPQQYTFPYEYLGENRVRLAKIGLNSFAHELTPLIKKYFQSENPEFENEIIERAYVSSDETTKYERLFETFLRERIVPIGSTGAKVLEPRKTSETNLTALLQGAKSRPSGYMQLVIGGVGAGKTTFLKRYFEFLIPPEISKSSIVTYFNFNEAPDDLADLNHWLCDHFIEIVRQNYGGAVRLGEADGLKSVFSAEINNNRGAYKLIRSASEDRYNERLANDMLSWMADRTLFAKALARHLSGDRGYSLIFVFDNVDRRDKEMQLKIFQTAQWFKNITRSFCIVSLRDVTFELYKSEPPLDAFINAGHFYIQPPRFVDMVRRRLDLAISYLVDESEQTLEYDIAGLGRVKYPKTNLGQYLNAIYVDLFKRRRKITMVLEGLAGKNVRRALDMFSTILTSNHLDARSFTTAIMSGGNYRIQETSLLKALMRTNYLYFYDGHGFVYNVFDFVPTAKFKNHLLKFEILEFLVENRKRPGDARLEGYFSTAYLLKKFDEMGFPMEDVHSTLEALLNQGLIVADHLHTAGLSYTDLVRVHASGFIHVRILAARVDYVAACALITPLFEKPTAEKIGRLWHINDPHTDIRRHPKNEIAMMFLKYLETQISELRAANSHYAQGALGASSLTNRIREGLGLVSRPLDSQVSDEIEMAYDRLFSDV